MLKEGLLSEFLHTRSHLRLMNYVISNRPFGRGNMRQKKFLISLPGKIKKSSLLDIHLKYLSLFH